MMMNEVLALITSYQGEGVLALSSLILGALLFAAAVAAARQPKVIYPDEMPQTAEDKILYPVILGLAHGNPPYKVPQTDALKVAAAADGIDSVRPMLERIYTNTQINNRHLAIPDFTPSNMEEGDSLLFNGTTDYQLPIQERLVRFRETAVPLVCRVAKEAMHDAGVSIDDIQKLIVVSSTGFLGPGLDCELIKHLGLSRGVDRTLIGFMGCAAAMNGFRVANDFARQEKNKGKYALMLCVEISSVHTTFDDNINDAILHAIFADGCAAAIIGGKSKRESPKGTLAIVEEHSCLTENTEDGITLAINANGISCTLSKHLSKYISQHIKSYVDSGLAKVGLKVEDVDFWGVHPGGTRIIEAVQAGVGLTPEQTADSWAVLGEYGNMLSPSIMYVLKRVYKRHREALSRGEEGYKTGFAFSFSPGVGVEGIILRQL